MLVDVLRDRLHKVLTTPKGDGFAPVRVPKDLARRMNVALGRPICSKEEAEKRRAAAQRLAELRARPRSVPVAREPAPVMIYFEKGRNERELGRMKEALDAKKIAYKLLDVAGDEATLAFVTREAKCEADQLPILFVAGRAIGGFREVVAADVSGELGRAIDGEPRT